MTEDSQRNFRSVYYEKVGFRGVEEKKSLEILLKDDRLGEFYKLKLSGFSHPSCPERKALKRHSEVFVTCCII